MEIPAMKVSPAKDRRICLLTLSRVPLMVSPTSACPVTWSPQIGNNEISLSGWKYKPVI
uniref:Uncharacterized protein n=1 Tax=Oryctolagus cuniculus TaxID=9986 RepID=A0A5F9CKY6_RABIT